MKAAERRIAPDVVHFPASFLPLRWKGRRSVVTVHDCSFLRNPAFFRKDRSIYYRRALRWTAKRADGIIACSKATADDLTRFTGFPADRVHVVYEAPCRTDRPAAEVIEAAQKRYRLPEKYILYLGAIEPRKNLVRLVSAFERTADLHDAHLVVAGRKGWKYGASVRAARRSSCRKRIHLPGYVEDQDVAAVMSGAQAFAYVSLWEGFGLPVADAMALGVPVLTSSVSSMPEVAGRCAVLAEPESVDSIAQGLTRLMQSRELRRHLSEAGRERADEFDWTTAARQTVEAYRQTLS
jgi:glycosyltransferase involved in cell wall biosynthesis